MNTGMLFRTSALAVVLAGAFASAVQAQEAAGDTREIEEIVVTAQKREQSLQDVPIVVTTVSGKLLRDDTLYTHMVRMAVAGDSLMRMLSSGQGLAGRLLNDATLYDRLNKLTTDLGAVLEDVRKDPRRYLKGMICVWNCK